jgi:hypothetical protein
MENNISKFSDYRKKRIIGKINYLQKNIETLAKCLVGNNDRQKARITK